MKNDCDSNLSLATGGFDHLIRIWQPSTGKFIQGFKHSESQVCLFNQLISIFQVNTLAFSRDGKLLAAGGYGRVRIYDVQGSTTPFFIVSDFTKNVNTVGFNDTGNWMFAGSEDKVAKIIDWRASCNLWVTRIYQVMYSKARVSLNSYFVCKN